MFTLFSSLSLLLVSPSLYTEVRSDTVPGRGAECRADVAVESRGDQPGPGAAVRLHLRSVRPAAIHLVLAQRRWNEGPAAPGPATGPGGSQRGGALALLPEDRPWLQQDAAAHQRWRRGPERVSVRGVSGRDGGRREEGEEEEEMDARSCFLSLVLSLSLRRCVVSRRGSGLVVKNWSPCPD